MESVVGGAIRVEKKACATEAEVDYYSPNRANSIVLRSMRYMQSTARN